MARALAQVQALHAEVRLGCVRASSSQPLSEEPRLRLIQHLVAVEESLRGSRDRTSEEIEAAAPSERFRLLASKQLDCRFAKCRRVGACLACTLRPCLCPELPPLRLRHRLWVVMHANEALRTTNSGKLLLLAHPCATLLVYGIPAHDEQLRQLVTRPTAVLLYPAEHALTPAQCAARAADGGGGGGGGGGGAGGSLDLIVVDGTWQQAKVLARQVPSSVPRVALAAAPSRSLFGSSVRVQSAEREAQGRVCTVEAVAMLALQMGEPPEEVRRLLGYLATFIGAYERCGAVRRRGAGGAGGGGGRGGGAAADSCTWGAVR